MNRSLRLRTLCIICLLTLAFAQSGYAQSNEAKSPSLFMVNDSVRTWQNDQLYKKNWEVGVDALSLIDKNTIPANNIFLRRNYTTEHGSQRAWRVRLGIDLSARDSVNIGDPLVNKLNSWYLLVRLGHEWQYRMEERAWLYFGGDIQFGYNRSYEKRILSIAEPPGGRFYEETFELFEPGLVGFAGAKYYLKPWVSLSIEASLSAIYRIRRNPSIVKSIEFPGGSAGRGFENSETIIVNIKPITILNLSFHF